MVRAFTVLLVGIVFAFFAALGLVGAALLIGPFAALVVLVAAGLTALAASSDGQSEAVVRVRHGEGRTRGPDEPSADS